MNHARHTGKKTNRDSRLRARSSRASDGSESRWRNHHGFSRRDLKADAGGKGSASHRERGEGRYEGVDVGERCRGGDDEGDGCDFFVDACSDVLLCLVHERMNE